MPNDRGGVTLCVVIKGGDILPILSFRFKALLTLRFGESIVMCVSVALLEPSNELYLQQHDS